MPIMLPGGFLILKLHNCRNWQGLDSLVKGLETLQVTNGLTALSQGHRITDTTEFTSYCAAKYRVFDTWDRENFLAGSPEGFLSIEFALPALDLENAPSISMSATKFGNLYNNMQFTGIYYRDTSSVVAAKYRESLMQLYVAMSRTLITLLAPDYVWISEKDENQTSITGSQVLAHQLEVVYWANYFGPNYLAPEIENGFLNAPVGIAKRLEGGIWYQLHEYFEVLDTELARQIEDKATSYFKSIFNLDSVQWLYKWPA
jgi:hypothetical protein